MKDKGTGMPTSRAHRATWEEMHERVALFPKKDRREVGEWVEHRRHGEEIAPGTMRQYLPILLRLSQAVAPHSLIEAEERGTLRDVARAMAERRNDGGKRRDPWMFLAPLDLFLRFHLAPKYYSENVAPWTKPPKGAPSTRAKRKRQRNSRQKTFNLVSVEEFNAALDAAEGPRDRALLYLLWDTGMRPGEILSLRFDSIENEDGILYAQLPTDDDPEPYFDLKTGDRRVVLIESVAAVKEWLNAHPLKRTGSPLWPSKRRDTKFQGRQVIDGLLDRVLPNHTAKDFRHTAATRATLDGWNEAQMRAFFGWEPDSPMPSYYAEFSNDDANRMRLVKAGLVPDANGKVKSALMPVQCSRCGTENVKSNVYCFACKGPLRADLISNAVDAADVLGRSARVEPLVREMVREALRKERESRSGR